MAMQARGYNLIDAPRGFYDALREAQHALDFADAYRMLLPFAFNFIQTTANHLTAVGLVLFYTADGAYFLQHSMIARARDIWIGANNLNSLGNVDCRVMGNTGVNEYRQIQTRAYDRGQGKGGWDNQFMRSAMTREYYYMYFVPFG